MTEQDIQEAEEHDAPPEDNEPEGDDEGSGDPPQEQETPVESEAERRAREKGWVPLEEYKGNPRKWVDADEFLKPQGKVREERDTLASEVQGLKRNIEMLTKDTQALREKAEQEGYDRAISELTERQRSAVAEGDTEAWEKLEAEKRKIEPPGKKKAEDGQQADPVVQGWLQENPWFNSDQALNMEAQAIHVRLSKKHPHMPLEENLRRVTEEIHRRYPEEFGIQPQEQKPNYRRPQKVSGTETRGSNASSGQKGWSDIPPDIRETAKSLIGEGKTYKTQADYAKAYFTHFPEG